MSELLGQVGTFFKFSNYETDSMSCKLVYRLQVMLLLFAGVVSLVNTYLGPQMTCLTSMGNQPDFDAYCFHAGIYIHGEMLENVTYFHWEPHPGVRPEHNIRVRLDPGRYSASYPQPEQITLSRLPLLPFIYFVIGLLIYLPRYRWEMVEGHIIMETVRNLNDMSLSEQQIENTVKICSRRFSQDRMEHTAFLYRYMSILVFYDCVLAAVGLFMVYYIARGNIYFAIDGLAYFETIYLEYPWRLAKAFPQRTNCMRPSGGPSGSIYEEDGLCDLHHIKIHMLLMSILFWVNVGNAVNIFREIAYLILKILFPPLARWRCRSHLNVDRNSDIGGTIDKLGVGSLHVVDLLLANLHRHRVYEILLDVKIDIENEAALLRQRMKGNF